jgi:hypothetical protein
VRTPALLFAFSAWLAAGCACSGQCVSSNYASVSDPLAASFVALARANDGRQEVLLLNSRGQALVLGSALGSTGDAAVDPEAGIPTMLDPGTGTAGATVWLDHVYEWQPTRTLRWLRDRAYLPWNQPFVGEAAFVLSEGPLPFIRVELQHDAGSPPREMALLDTSGLSLEGATVIDALGFSGDELASLGRAPSERILVAEVTSSSSVALVAWTPPQDNLTPPLLVYATTMPSEGGAHLLRIGPRVSPRVLVPWTTRGQDDVLAVFDPALGAFVDQTTLIGLRGCREIVDDGPKSELSADHTLVVLCQGENGNFAGLGILELASATSTPRFVEALGGTIFPDGARPTRGLAPMGQGGVAYVNDTQGSSTVWWVDLDGSRNPSLAFTLLPASSDSQLELPVVDGSGRYMVAALGDLGVFRRAIVRSVWATDADDVALCPGGPPRVCSAEYAEFADPAPLCDSCPVRSIRPLRPPI